jgi:polyisoprenoid-binding protein YceI
LPPEELPALSRPAAQGLSYTVIPDESLLTVAVFRAGTLARAGHNHVIASHDVTGTVYVNPEIERSSFELKVPVSSMTIDEPELRAVEGEEFPPDVPQSARDGTRRNMLSPAVLDGERYPEITLVSERLELTADGMLAQVQVRILDQVRTIAVPVHYDKDELSKNTLRVTGEVTLKQTDLGMTPFTALGGMLAVKDEMRVRFRIVARPAPS